MIKRLIVVFGVLIALVLVVFACVTLWANHHLERQQRQLQLLQESAETSTLNTRALIQSGQFQLAAVIPAKLVASLLEQLEGYQQITSKGNRFAVNQVQSSFHDGYIELTAKAHFAWRFGFYDGPIDVVYRGYARVDELGQCHLHLRVVDARPHKTFPGLESWLSSLVRVRLQQKLKIPDIQLPINYQKDLVLPDMQHTLKQMQVDLPGRTIGIDAPAALAFTSSTSLGLVVPVTPNDSGMSQTVALPLDSPDIVIAMSAKFLNDIIQAYVVPDHDVLVSSERVKDVWTKEMSFLGKEFKNHVDILSIDGYLDVNRSQLSFTPEDVTLAIAMDAYMNGFLEAEMMGMSATVPFSAQTDTALEQLPMIYDSETRSFHIESGEIEIPIHIEVPIGTRKIGFNYPLKFDLGQLAGEIQLPQVVTTQVKIPTQVERKSIVKTRSLTLDIQWQLDLPSSHLGFVVTTGRVTLENANLAETPDQ